LALFVGIDESIERNFQESKETSIVVGIENKGIGVDPNGYINIQLFFSILYLLTDKLFFLGERVDELTPFANSTYGGGKGDLYLDFLLNNIKPFIDQSFRTKSSREFTGIMGSSLGGLFSFYAGLKYQQHFSKIGIFSPSFWFSRFF